MNTEKSPRAVVFKEPGTGVVYGEDSEEVVSRPSGVGIGVRLDGKIIWQKDVLSHHVGWTGSTVKTRFQEHKIKRALKKANRIANRFNK